MTIHHCHANHLRHCFSWKGRWFPTCWFRGLCRQPVTRFLFWQNFSRFSMIFISAKFQQIFNNFHFGQIEMIKSKTSEQIGRSVDNGARWEHHQSLPRSQGGPSYASKSCKQGLSFVLYLPPMTEVTSVPRQVARVLRICRTGWEEVGVLSLSMSLEGGFHICWSRSSTGLKLWVGEADQTLSSVECLADRHLLTSHLTLVAGGLLSSPQSGCHGAPSPGIIWSSKIVHPFTLEYQLWAIYQAAWSRPDQYNLFKREKLSKIEIAPGILFKLF